MSDTIPQDDTPRKQCSKCPNSFPATSEYFQVDRTTANGLKSHCKQCSRRLRRESYLRLKKEKADLVPPDELQCSDCKEWKPSSQFHKEPTMKTGLSLYCKPCQHARAKRSLKKPANKAVQVARRKQYNLEHREQQAAWQRQWYQKNREYALEKDRQERKEHPGILATRWQRWAKTERGYEHCRMRVRNRSARRKGARGNFTHANIMQKYALQKGQCYYCKAKIGKGKSEYHIEHVIPIVRGGSNDINNIVLACPACNLSKGTRLPHEWPEGGRLL